MSERKRRYERKTTLKQDIKDIVRDFGLLTAPRVIRERKNDIDRRYEGQTTDSNNRY